LDWIYFGQITNKILIVNLDETFFGITLDYKLAIHKKIFWFLYNSQGGFTHSCIYTLPISIRNLYFDELNGIIVKHNEKIKRN